MAIKITIESSGDVPKNMAEETGIITTPLTIVCDGEPKIDGIDITAPELCEVVEKRGSSTSTAAISIGDFLSLFESLTENGDEVIHFSISSKISACYQNALLAAKELGNGKVHVIDTKTLSSGMNYIALTATRLVKEGKTVEEVVEIAKEYAEKVHVFFVLNTLKYMAKGGRCSSVLALGANLLKLKPCIGVTDGKMDVTKKYRGTIMKSLSECIDEQLADGGSKIDKKLCFVTCSPHTPQDVIDMSYEKAKAFGFEEIIFGNAGCTITNHCGPSCLGLIYSFK
jgi:EDD domain protein, DegV family